MLLRAAEIWALEPSVMTPLLKFLAELVLNKGQRLTFDCSSPNGILLFRETSKILVTYGAVGPPLLPYTTSTPVFLQVAAFSRRVRCKTCTLRGLPS